MRIENRIVKLEKKKSRNQIRFIVQNSDGNYHLGDRLMDEIEYQAWRATLPANEVVLIWDMDLFEKYHVS